MGHLGDIKTSVDYQVLKQGPMDARLKKKRKSDLINIEAWPHESNTIYIYKTMLVGIEETGEIYKLIDPAKMFEPDYSGWELLGSGNEISIIVDTTLDTNSENPVQNKVIAKEIETIKKDIEDQLDYDIVGDVTTPEGNPDLSGYATIKWVQEQLDIIKNAMLQKL